MCWSKRSPDTEDSGPTTTRKPMETIKCPGSSVDCGDAHKTYCSGHGLCCRHSDKDPGDPNYMTCVCHSDWMDKYCQNRKPEFSRDDYKPTQAIVVFSAILGVIVITLFVALIVLQIKYYRKRKKLHRKNGDHELIVISGTDAGENGRGSKKRLIIQPGYSWRESVRRAHSKASQKFRSTLSRSVPEDLFQVGLKMAFLGGWKPNQSPVDQKSVDIEAEVKAQTTHRCFSAGPDSSPQTAFDVGDPANANDRPSVVQLPATSPPEDTVK